MKGRRFILLRVSDESGMSGNGVVADGCLFPNGRVALTWRKEPFSMTWHLSVEEVLIHSHGGKTRLHWIDKEEEEVSIAASRPVSYGDQRRGRVPGPPGVQSPDWPVHFVYKSKHGMARDYFACETDAQKGAHRQTTTWTNVTCPECLKGAVLQWDFLQTTVEIAPVALVGQGGGIFGSTIIGEDLRPLEPGEEVRVSPPKANRKTRRALEKDGFRGVIVQRSYDGYLVLHHKSQQNRRWTREDLFPVSELELLSEAGEK